MIADFSKSERKSAPVRGKAMDKATAAKQLSAMLGRDVPAHRIGRVEGKHIALIDGKTHTLPDAGNCSCGLHERLAQNLSASLGRKVTPAQISYIGGDHGNLVRLASGEMYRLFGGNAAYKAGSGQWFVNGRAGAGEAEGVPRVAVI